MTGFSLQKDRFCGFASAERKLDSLELHCKAKKGRKQKKEVRTDLNVKSVRLETLRNFFCQILLCQTYRGREERRGWVGEGGFRTLLLRNRVYGKNSLHCFARVLIYNNYDQITVLLMEFLVLSLEFCPPPPPFPPAHLILSSDEHRASLNLALPGQSLDGDITVCGFP